jgi:hypothetical protein
VIPTNQHDPHANLRTACERLLGYVENQLALDDTLAPEARTAAPVESLNAALRSGAVTDLLAAGRAAADWIVQNATDEERWDWATGCSLAEVDDFELAAAWFDDDAPEPA